MFIWVWFSDRFDNELIILNEMLGSIRVFPSNELLKFNEKERRTLYPKKIYEYCSMNHDEQ